MTVSLSSPDSAASAARGQSAPNSPVSQDSAQERRSGLALEGGIANNEEPELRIEPDVPSDGRDERGEEMIRDLPQRPVLAEPQSPSRS